ncbi:MAG: hypothetical protein U5R06_10150 [candidate division KSB1 bacterium]|nr:hypothetical protein [candidate division KSB1 bacterium]
MISVRLYIIALLLGLLTLSPAQSLRIPVFPHSRHTLSLGMQQEFNTYLWNIGLDYSKKVNSRLGFHITETFRSSMLQSSRNQNKWKDDQTLTFGLQYGLGSDWMLVSDLSSVLYTDNQSGFNNDVRTHRTRMGLVYDPGRYFRGYATAGPKWDNKLKHDDKGATYAVRLEGKNLNWQEYNNDLAFSIQEERYKTRRNRDLNVNYLVGRQFSDFASDSLTVFVNQERHDNYVTLNQDIESQRQYERGLENDLFYRISELADLRVNTAFTTRDVEVKQFGETLESRSRKRTDQRLANDVTLRLDHPWLKGHFTLSHYLQEQRYDLNIEKQDHPFSQRTAFITPDNKSSRIRLNSRLDAAFSPKDTLETVLSISKYQYDTPDEENFDDRDELRINSRLLYSHVFNELFAIDLLASVNLYHMVYIFGERSADNNWNRILRLKPSLRWKPFPSLVFHQSFEVLSNYVDYDFEDKTPATRSFVFRKFAVEDSLLWKIFPHTSLSLDYRLQLEENGQLFWKDWTEKILVTRRKQWLHFYLKYKKLGYIHIAPGFQYTQAGRMAA